MESVDTVERKVLAVVAVVVFAVVLEYSSAHPPLKYPLYSGSAPDTGRISRLWKERPLFKLSYYLDALTALHHSLPSCSVIFCHATTSTTLPWSTVSGGCLSVIWTVAPAKLIFTDRPIEGLLMRECARREVLWKQKYFS